MSYSRPWSEEEDQALHAYYPKHGPQWEGWGEVLPGRTRRAIRNRANKLGLLVRVPRVTTRTPPTDPHEKLVLMRMAAGLTPREIDREQHWIPNTAHDILVGRWERESGGKQ